MTHDYSDSMIDDMYLGSRWLVLLTLMIHQFQFIGISIQNTLVIIIGIGLLTLETLIKYLNRTQTLKKAGFGLFQVFINLGYISLIQLTFPQYVSVVMPILFSLILITPFYNPFVRASQVGFFSAMTYFVLNLKVIAPAYWLNALVGATLLFIFSILVASIHKQYKIVLEKNFYALEEISFKNQLLEKSSKTDFLTEMYNHQTFYKALEDTSQNHAPVALILLDIDNFKQINDIYGHIMGDFVIREVASIIRRQIRPTDIAARYGGEEFAILLPKATCHEGQVLAERIRSAIALHQFHYDNIQLNVTVSGGVGTTTISLSKHDQSKFVDYVDELLYIAKKNGKNRIELDHEFKRGSEACLV